MESNDLLGVIGTCPVTESLVVNPLFCSVEGTGDTECLLFLCPREIRGGLVLVICLATYLPLLSPHHLRPAMQSRYTACPDRAFVGPHAVRETCNRTIYTCGVTLLLVKRNGDGWLEHNGMYTFQPENGDVGTTRTWRNQTPVSVLVSV